MSDVTTFLPRMPQPINPVSVPPPKIPGFTPKIKEQREQSKTAIAPEKEDSLISWLVSSAKKGIKQLPKMIKPILISIAVVTAINFLFFWVKTENWLPTFIRTPIIFFTAAYNQIIPKTIYWIIILTFGKKLFKKIRKNGLFKAISPVFSVIPEFKKSLLNLSEKSYSLLLLGGGIGLVVANNFASYAEGRPQAMNKFDKYFVAIVISFAVSYLLGESRKGWLFKVGHFASKDIAKIIKKPNLYTDDYTFIILSSFVMGLLLDAPIIYLKFMYGGYILGGVCLLAAIVLPFLLPTMKSKRA